MVTILKLSTKMVQLSIVSYRLWADAAVWRTSRSGLKGWLVQWTKFGVRVITPLLGAAFTVDWRDREQTGSEV